MDEGLQERVYRALSRAQAATQQHREQWEPESHGGPSSFTLPLDMEHTGLCSERVPDVGGEGRRRRHSFPQSHGSQDPLCTWEYPVPRRDEDDRFAHWAGIGEDLINQHAEWGSCSARCEGSSHTEHDHEREDDHYEAEDEEDGRSSIAERLSPEAAEPALGTSSPGGGADGGGAWRQSHRSMLAEREGVIGELAVLQQQQCDTVRELLRLRVEQLQLRIQQLSALSCLLDSERMLLLAAPRQLSTVQRVIDLLTASLQELLQEPSIAGEDAMRCEHAASAAALSASMSAVDSRADQIANMARTLLEASTFPFPSPPCLLPSTSLLEAFRYRM
mmetsp:Transcript_22567/g.43003  ORF Transcript_22567/g.43003 Transcript_22567/m.43003 type:complete len:333 (+) Transcript_22567:114-1112(+)